MLKKHTISIKHAVDGIVWSLKTQPNYVIHLVLSLVSVVAGFALHISYYEFLIIILLIVIGLTVETVNTSIEEATDAIDLKIRDDIKIAKDVSAAAVLIFSIGSICIAAIIFLPKLLSLFVSK